MNSCVSKIEESFAQWAKRNNYSLEPDDSIEFDFFLTALYFKRWAESKGFVMSLEHVEDVGFKVKEDKG